MMKSFISKYWVWALVLLIIVFWVLMFWPIAPFAHFDHYYFFPVGEPFWKGAVWGNVIADFPNIPVVVLILGPLAYVINKFWIKPLHKKLDAGALEREKLLTMHEDAAIDRKRHGEHLKVLMDALDPESDGGLTDVQKAVERVEDAVKLDTPGGLQEIDTKIQKLLPTD